MGKSVNENGLPGITREQIVGRHIGILGGMFDPVHQGHLQVALTALQELSLDQVRLMPCARPVHRESAIASDKDRIAMLNAAISGYSGIVIDDRECRRPDLSYTYDSLVEMRNEQSEDVLFLLMGSDTFSTLESWYHWQELLDQCHIVLVSRPGFKPELSKQLETLVLERASESLADVNSRRNGYIYTGLSSQIDLSSTKVREALASGQNLAGLVPAGVAEYIAQHSLYQS
jgi:nicotinate-nucleotide adenylyltransferase